MTGFIWRTSELALSSTTRSLDRATWKTKPTFLQMHCLFVTLWLLNGQWQSNFYVKILVWSSSVCWQDHLERESIIAYHIAPHPNQFKYFWMSLSYFEITLIYEKASAILWTTSTLISLCITLKRRFSAVNGPLLLYNFADCQDLISLYDGHALMFWYFCFYYETFRMNVVTNKTD